MGFTDHRGEPAEVPDPPAEGSAYAQIGRFQAGEYHRNAFARHTAQEAGVLAEVLAVRPGDRVVDVGCGDGRHVAALAARGVAAVGIDLSPEVLRGSRTGAPSLVAARAAALPLADAAVDGLMSVCQGGFGITPSHDRAAVAEWARVVRPGGRLALTAFSLAFAARYLAEGEALDLDRGLHHHVADVRGPDGARQGFDLWTAAYSVPHLVDLLEHHGWRVVGTAGVEPGGYQRVRPPTVLDPEVLIWAERRE
ncbi:class I SAM-dependent methyltransferase [Euzebya sp.]|uniref:class I SAM-dependent methyltransferase n=1 Tax=Euzebya sp. TaxID=1971409 RepID=UPI0035155B97